MTGRTHDLAAITAVTAYLATQPLFTLSLGTAAVAVIANQFGAMTPDIDHHTSLLWDRIPAGSIIGKIIRPLLGSHRMLSHSLIGLFLFSLGIKFLLGYARTFLLVDLSVVGWAFVLGYFSHLIMDSLTKDGVPWLFPLPVRFGFPPFEFLRFTTDKLGEKIIIFPGLLLANGVLVYFNYSKFVDLFTRYLIK
jgi:inner membrane protein